MGSWRLTNIACCHERFSQSLVINWNELDLLNTFLALGIMAIHEETVKVCLSRVALFQGVFIIFSVSSRWMTKFNSKSKAKIWATKINRVTSFGTMRQSFGEGLIIIEVYYRLA